MKKNDFEENVDYRAMYYRMAAAVEDAIRVLICAQQDCEEILLQAENDKKCKE